MLSATDIPEHELRDAYHDAGLSLLGWTFERAMKSDLVREALYANVRANHKKHERQHGTPAPMQRALI